MRVKFFDLSIDLLCIANAEGYFVDLNPAWSRLGWTVEELKGKPYLEFVHPDDHTSTESEAAAIVGGRNAVTFQNRYRRKDGGYTRLSWTATWDAETQLLYAVAHDVTPIYREREIQLQRILDSLPNMAFTTGPDGNNTWVSQRWIEYTGLTIERTRTHWQDVIHSDDIPRVGQAWAACMESGTPWEIEYKIREAATGNYRLHIGRSVPLRDATGSIVQWVGSATDVDDERRKAEIAIRDQTESLLREKVADLERANAEMSLLNSMGDMLAACLSTDEAYAVIQDSLTKLFPDEAGGLFVINESKDIAEPQVQWGNVPPMAPFSAESDCWALRRGKAHTGSPICVHVLAQRGLSLCIPMMAGSTALGVLYLRGCVDRKQLAVATAEHIALTLANMRLRDQLRHQSVRDPLTKLYNRRFMSEALIREIGRSVRSRSPLAVLMIDVDHFKRFNDVHGHEAGDRVLASFGEHLQRTLRASDIACRYGGEEFTVVLPDASLPAALARAEKLREQTTHLVIEHYTNLDPVSISLGVAIYPDHGTTAEALLQAADRALYVAKAKGRNRVEAAKLEERQDDEG